MKKTEITLALLTLIAYLLLYYSVDGGAMLMALFCAALYCLYLFFSFALLNNIGGRKIFKKASYHLIGRFKIVAAVITGFGLSASVLSILFILLNWEGQAIVFKNALTALGFSTILVIIERIINGPSVFFKNAIMRILIWGIGASVALRLATAFI